MVAAPGSMGPLAVMLPRFTFLLKHDAESCTKLRLAEPLGRHMVANCSSSCAPAMSRSSWCEGRDGVYLGNPEPCVWVRHELCSAASFLLGVEVLTLGHDYRIQINREEFS